MGGESAAQNVINHYDEQEKDECVPLEDASGCGKTAAGGCVVKADLRCCPLVERHNCIYQRHRYAIHKQDLSERIAIYGVKRFAEVNKDDI